MGNDMPPHLPSEHPFPITDPAVAAVFDGFAEDVRPGLLRLRSLILETAAATPEVGRIEETLKWGQPSYLTPDTRAGTTIRLGVPKSGGFAIYTNCQTSLIADFRALFPEDFIYEGNRAVHFRDGSILPTDQIRLLIRAALTYRLSGHSSRQKRNAPDSAVNLS